MQGKSVITRVITVAAGVFAPGQLGELTQVVDFALVDAVLAETGVRKARVRLLPPRVVAFFILALALSEDCGYRAVWGKMTCALTGLDLVCPHSCSLARARRRLGAAPLKVLFEAVSGVVAWRDTPGAYWRGMRTVAIDGTGLQLPDRDPVTARYAKRGGARETGYPLLRLLTLVETGTRSVIAAVFGPESQSESTYAKNLLGALGPGMLLLMDAGFDAWELLRDVRAVHAHYLVRSSARRCPTIQRRLPDGSYLARLGGGTLPVRVIEARITITLHDGTVRREQWRLITDLLDHARYPACDLVTLYHERWQAETAYASLKATLIDGRVLRSGHPEDIEQEVRGILTVYQALIRTAAHAAASRPGLDMDRLSFTVALDSARNQVIPAVGILPEGQIPLVGGIGLILLANLLPAKRRQRLKARSLKTPASTARTSANNHPPARTTRSTPKSRSSRTA